MASWALVLGGRGATGRNVLDPARRAPAARAGHAQAGPALGRVATVWDG